MVKLEFSRFYTIEERKMKTAIRYCCIHLAAAILLTTCLSAQAAEPDSADMIQYRKNVMQARRAHVKAATLIIQGKVDFQSQLIDHARALEALNKDTASLFPNGSDVGETGAMRSVWNNNNEFIKRSKDTAQKAAKFAKTVAAGDTQNYSAHLTELLDSCKYCHKDFRKKEAK